MAVVTLLDQLIPRLPRQAPVAVVAVVAPEKPKRRRWFKRPRRTKAARLAREAAIAADIRAKREALWARLNAEALRVKAVQLPPGVSIVERQECAEQ